MGQLEDLQAKGFGSHGGKQHVHHGSITPLKSRVLVSKMHFGETRSKGGIILIDDDGSENDIHPRWAEVYAIGNKQDNVKVQYHINSFNYFMLNELPKIVKEKFVRKESYTYNSLHWC